jgi:hypothetical protein
VGPSMGDRPLLTLNRVAQNLLCTNTDAKDNAWFTTYGSKAIENLTVEANRGSWLG